jgi:hypothetical protein
VKALWVITFVVLFNTASIARASGTTFLTKADYPKHTSIQVIANAPNITVDCLWGFNCAELRPNFHSIEQGDLHRTGGFLKFGSYLSANKKKLDQYEFAFVYNEYDQPENARRAFMDFTVTALNQESSGIFFQDSPVMPEISSKTDQAFEGMAWLPYHSQIVALCLYRGNTEVEIAARWNRDSDPAQEQKMNKYLIKQVTAYLDHSP